MSLVLRYVLLALKVDRDGSGTISLTEYFGIFEEHGVKMSKSESERLGIYQGLYNALLCCLYIFYLSICLVFPVSPLDYNQ